MIGFESFAGKARDARAAKLNRNQRKAEMVDPSKETLKQRHPDLARRWDPFRNGGKKSTFVKADSKFAYWWKCPRGPDHEWSMSIQTFASKGADWCPCCRNLQVSRTNSLATVAPSIAAQWHPTKNRSSISPATVLATADASAWWQCDVAADHVWAESIRVRAQWHLATERRNKNAQDAIEPVASTKMTPKKKGGGAERGSLLNSSIESTTTPNPMMLQQSTIGGGDFGIAGGGNANSTENSAGTTGARDIAKNQKQGGRNKENSRPIERREGPVSVSTASITTTTTTSNDDDDDDNAVPTASPNSAATHRGACPCCSGLKVSVTNCVATVAPTVALMWHPKKNKVRGVHSGDGVMRRLKPNRVLATSTQLCWLRCAGFSASANSLAPGGESDSFHEFAVPIREACLRASSGLPNAQVPCPHCARDIVERVLRAVVGAAVDDAEERRVHGARSKWFGAKKKRRRKRGSAGATSDDEDEDEDEEEDGGSGGSKSDTTHGSARSPTQRGGRSTAVDWLATLRTKVLSPLVDAVRARKHRTVARTPRRTKTTAASQGSLQAEVAAIELAEAEAMAAAAAAAGVSGEMTSDGGGEGATTGAVAHDQGPMGNSGDASNASSDSEEESSSQEEESDEETGLVVGEETAAAVGGGTSGTKQESEGGVKSAACVVS